MLTALREGFVRDTVIALVATVILGAAAASGVARAVDTYLGGEVVGVLGDLGEYDLILHVRADVRDAARSEIARILGSSFKGARFEEGPTVIGRANFLIALPDELRTRSGLEGLARALGEVPGASGETYIIEPRLSVSGIETGAFQHVMGLAEKIHGVRFCFRDGSTLAVVTRSVDDLGSVSRALEDLLARHRLIEVRFPLGQTMNDPVASGAAFAKDLAALEGVESSRDVTPHGRSTDLVSLTTTLTEMKRFLQYYAARAAISIEGDAPLRPGDEVFVAAPAAPPASATSARARANVQSEETAGAAVPAGVVVRVSEVERDRASGIVVDGDAGVLGFAAGKAAGTFETPRLSAYALNERGVPGRRVGTAVVTSESRKIAYVVDESVGLLRDLEQFRDDAYEATVSALDILGVYDRAVGELVNVQRALENASQALGGAPERGLGWREAAMVQDALQKAMGIVDSLESALHRVGDIRSRARQALSAAMDLVDERPSADGMATIDEFAAKLGPVAGELRRWKSTLSSMAGTVDGIRALLATGRAGAVVDATLDATNSLLAQVQAIDVPGMQEAMREVLTSLKAVGEIDTGSIIRELEYIKASLPNLGDDEVGKSIRLIDRYIGGEVIPGDALQLLVGGAPTPAAVKAAAARRFGSGVRVYINPAGVVEPGVRSRVYQVLHEARGTVAALASFVLVLMSLVLDHAAVTNALREVRRGRPARRRAGSLDAAAAYSMAVGAATLVPVYALSGASLPQMGLCHVAVLGALMGYLVATQAEKLSPAPSDEILAGIAMGLSFTDVMREIVIPSSRPGLLRLLNTKRFRLRGSPG